MKTILATVGFVLSLGLSFGLTGCAGSETGEPTGATQSNIEKGGKNDKGDTGGCVDEDGKAPTKPIDKKPVDKDGSGDEGADKGKTPTKEEGADDGYGGKTPEKPTDGSGKGEGDAWGEEDGNDCGCK